MSEDRIHAARWARLSAGAQGILLGRRPINVSHLLALTNRGYTDSCGRPTALGDELTRWARRHGHSLEVQQQ